MAKWLDKYEQGGMVLKQKTKDNYDKQSNYNDADASVGPGFKGLAYNLQGRNYSPAWGGQFKDGGEIITKRKDFKPGLLSYIPGLSSLASGNQPTYNRHEMYGPLGDLYRYYGGLPLKHDVLMDSQNKPGKAKDKNAKYISLNRDPEFVNEVLDNYKRVSSGKLDKEESKLGDDNWQVSGYSSNGVGAHRTNKQGSEHHSNAIGRYTLGKGKDEKGEYISYYDKFDQGTGSGINPGETLGLTKPFEIYDRIYLDSKTGKPKMTMGGGIPGSVGFTYARTQDPAPSNGKYAKKTKASAQNGKEMAFYQQGLDFTPKTISKNGSVIKDDMGQWAHPGEVTEIGSNDITMQGVDYPVLGVSDTGDTKMMQPGEDYKFKGKKVTEFPMMQNGGWLDIVNKSNALKSPEDRAKFAAIQNNANISQWNPKPGEQKALAASKQVKKDEENSWYNNKHIKSLRNSAFAEPLPYELAAAAAAAYYGGPQVLPYIAPALEAEIGGIAGLTTNNLLTAGAATQGLTSLSNTKGSVVDAYNNPNWNTIGNAVGNVALNALDFIPMVSTVAPEVKAAINASKESGLLSNTWKINPTAYQYNLPENVMYRGIGESGAQDALESRVFRAKQNVAPSMQGRFDMSKQFSKPYFSPKFNVADTYGQGYIAEVPSDATTFGMRYGKGKTWSQIAQEDIPIEKGKILKKDWLQGYKEVPKKENGGWLSKYGI